MKILLAPSEAKNSGGDYKFNPCSLLFEELCPLREELIAIYEKVVNSNNLDELKELFGFKKESDIARYKSKRLIGSLATEAVNRYSGVVFSHLDYKSLDDRAKEYINKNLLIFSNLFGVLRANDLICDYRLKQGASLDGIKLETLYKKELSPLLDEFLKDEEILDLRASFYEKFYIPNREFTILKFLKDGKSVSHWAKAYRGRVLRAIAKAGANSIDEVIALPLEGLKLLEIQQRAKRQIVIYEIVE